MTVGDLLPDWILHLPGVTAVVGIAGLSGWIDPLWLLIQQVAPTAFGASSALVAIAPHVPGIAQDSALTIFVAFGLLYLLVSIERVVQSISKFIKKVKS